MKGGGSASVHPDVANRREHPLELYCDDVRCLLSSSASRGRVNVSMAPRSSLEAAACFAAVSLVNVAACRTPCIGGSGAPKGDVRGVGAGGRSRTRDQRFTKPLLYQLSYAGPRERALNLHGFFLSLKGFNDPYLNRTMGCSLTEAPWPGSGRQRGFCSLPYCSRAILSTCHLV